MGGKGVGADDLSEKDLRSTKTRSRRISPSQPAGQPFEAMRELAGASVLSISLRDCNFNTRFLSREKYDMKIKITIFDDLLGCRTKKVC